MLYYAIYEGHPDVGGQADRAPEGEGHHRHGAEAHEHPDTYV